MKSNKKILRNLTLKIKCLCVIRDITCVIKIISSSLGRQSLINRGITVKYANISHKSMKINFFNDKGYKQTIHKSRK